MVSLTPLYADPARTTTDIDLNLHPFGYRGPQDLLNFRAYKGMAPLFSIAMKSSSFSG
jgi:hypothetical protein